MKYLYTLIILSLLVSCDNEDFEQATIAFYPTVVMSVEEPDDTETISINLESSGSLKQTSGIKIKVHEFNMVYGENYITNPPQFTSGEIILEMQPDEIKTSFDITLINDLSLQNQNYQLKFEIVGVNGDLESTGGNLFQLDIEDNTAPLAEANFDNNCSEMGSLFTEILVSGAEYQTESSWLCTDFGESGSAIEANAFSNDDSKESNAYLIMNALDVSNLVSITIEASIYSRFSGPGVLTVLYSSDYDGSGNPEGFTWTNIEDITNNLPDAGSRAWVDLSASIDDLPDGNIYIAFLFKGGFGGSSSNWRVDNFKVTGQ